MGLMLAAVCWALLTACHLTILEVRLDDPSATMQPSTQPTMNKEEKTGAGIGHIASSILLFWSAYKSSTKKESRNA